jgi:CheY-like chemotaxis protein
MAARILIAEDHPTMRDAMRLVLEGEGFEISEASDGQSALSMVRAAPPDIVFLDMNMPGSNGENVLSEIKGNPDTAAVHVIVVTASGEEGRARALSLGADGYFTKPFNPTDLLQTVEHVLGPGGS